MWKLSKRRPFDVFTNLVYCLILIIHATHVKALLQTSYTLYQQVSNAKHVPYTLLKDLVIYYCITKETITEDV